MRITVGSLKEYLESYPDDAVFQIGDGDIDSDETWDYGFLRQVDGGCVTLHPYIPYPSSHRVDI